MLPDLHQWKSFEELYSLQEDRLAWSLEQASRSSFYRNKDLCSILTTKNDLRSMHPFGMLAVKKEELATYHESSGSTGEPTASYLTDSDWDDITTRFVRSRVNLRLEDSVLIKTPYSMVTTAHQMHRAARLRGSLVVPADNRSSIMPYSKVVRLLQEIPITLSWSLPTEVLFWAKAARAWNKNPKQDFPALRAFFVAGEALGEAKRKRMSEIWGAKPVIQDYGSTETGSLAGECSHGTLHLWADRLRFEVYDGKRLSRTGRGQLVVTTLYRRAMPLVRYVLEDEVAIEEESCPCGWILPTVRIFGRLSSCVQIQGKRIFPGDIEDAVYSLPIEYGVEFWRGRYTPRSLEIEIETVSGQERTAKKTLEHLLHSKMGIRPTVRVQRELVDSKSLTQKYFFQKPRFLFHANEDWGKAIHY